MESTLIAQIMVIGEGKRFPAALIVPAFEELKKWAGKNGISGSTKEDLIKDPKVIEKYQHVLDKTNESFGHWEQVKKFVLLPNEWTIDGGELTPKLSLKRKVILERTKELIDHIYSDEHDQKPREQHP